MNEIRHAKNLFLNGFFKGEFKSSPTLEKLNSTLLNLYHPSKLNEGFQWEEKYKHSVDLRPNVYTYDSVFLDILFENNIPELIQNICGLNLTLAHLQLRKSFIGPSYMDWHRDEYFNKEGWVGMAPPVFKLIYYPQLGAVQYPKLKVIPSSHRKMNDNLRVDKLKVLFCKKETVYSSDSEFLFFNTTLFHKVIPEVSAQGTIRVIYIFTLPWQLDAFTEQATLHKDYAKRLESSLKQGLSHHEGFSS